MAPILHTDAMTVSGKPLSAMIDLAEVYDANIIRPLDNPITRENGLAVLRGNLAPAAVSSSPPQPNRAC